MKQYKKWSEVRNARLTPKQRARVDRRVEAELLELSLADLRTALDKTQAEIAAAAEMSQSELSRIERRSDHLVSTLRRCVRALGGELEITAVVGDKRVRLNV